MKDIKENLSEISDQLDEHLAGPISIARNNIISNLEYSDNFEVSFEYKASVVPSSGWHQICIGTLIISGLCCDDSKSLCSMN